jgi:glycosyltransferase involved in cell wall biosynthesis
MKLLFVIPEYSPHAGGGIITFYRNLLPELVKQGHQVHALVGSAFTSQLPSYEADGVTVEFLDHVAVDANLAKFGRYAALPELQRHLSAAWTAFDQAGRGEGFDLVETTDWGFLFVPWIIERDSPPTVVQLHGSVGQIDFHDPRRGEELSGFVARMMETQLLACADELHSYSQTNAAEWQSRTNREVLHIAPPWSPSSRSINPEKLSSHALVVGRIQYWKGVTVLCEALRLLGDRAPHVDWIGRDTTVGDASLSMSAHLARAYPDVWQTRIHPIGPMSPNEVAEFQAGAEFVLVPSTWDVLNFTCVEAMGHERVVLCSAAAGASGLITDGEDGLVFPAGDPSALADAIARFQEMSSAARIEMGKRAKLKTDSALAPAQVAKAHAERYVSVAQQGSSSSSVPNDWLNEACKPHQPLTESLAFLDRLPLRDLSRYVSRRTLRKVTRV